MTNHKIIEKADKARWYEHQSIKLEELAKDNFRRNRTQSAHGYLDRARRLQRRKEVLIKEIVRAMNREENKNDNQVSVQEIDSIHIIHATGRKGNESVS